MSSKLRYELHAMVDDAPTVDVIDRALGAARGMGRRRVGAGVVATLVVAGALTSPFTLFGAGGSGGSPALVGSPADTDCAPGVTGPVISSAGPDVSPVAPLIVGHLPTGYTLARTREGVWCGPPGPQAVDAHAALDADGGQVWVELVPRAEQALGTIYLGALPRLSGNNCLLTFGSGPLPSSAPSDVSSPSGAPSSSVPSGAPEPSYPEGSSSFTPSYSPWPSDTPSYPLSGSPSPGDDFVIGNTVFCYQATEASPIVFGFGIGSAVVVAASWSDDRAIIARWVPAGTGTQVEPVTVDQLTALVTDPALLAQVGQD